MSRGFKPRKKALTRHLKNGKRKKRPRKFNHESKEFIGRGLNPESQTTGQPDNQQKTKDKKSHERKSSLSFNLLPALLRALRSNHPAFLLSGMPLPIDFMRHSPPWSIPERIDCFTAFATTSGAERLECMSPHSCLRAFLRTGRRTFLFRRLRGIEADCFARLATASEKSEANRTSATKRVKKQCRIPESELL